MGILRHGGGTFEGGFGFRHAAHFEHLLKDSAAPLRCHLVVSSAFRASEIDATYRLLLSALGRKANLQALRGARRSPGDSPAESLARPVPRRED